MPVDISLIGIIVVRFLILSGMLRISCTVEASGTF